MPTNIKSIKIDPAPFDTKLECIGNVFPTILRLLIVGTSGSGKTTVLWNIVTKCLYLYDYLYIYTKTLDQPIYQRLMDLFVEFPGVAYFSDDFENMIPVEECKPKSLVIFDDCLKETQTEIEKYFMMGRHKNISCIYVSQCYSMVGLKLIRTNINYLCVFNLINHYTRKMYDDYCASDMTFDKFNTLCQTCWKTQYGFISINLSYKCYRRCLEEIIYPINGRN